MLTQYEYARNYLFTALESAPGLFEHLLVGLTPAEEDFRPEAERFTLREMVCHLASWERVLRERMEMTQHEDTPTLPLFDEKPLLEHDYPHADTAEQLRLFRELRAETVAFLRSCGPDDWDRDAQRQMVGPMTLEAQALLIPFHDTYHYAQITEWRAAFAAGQSVVSG